MTLAAQSKTGSWVARLIVFAVAIALGAAIVKARTLVGPDASGPVLMALVIPIGLLAVEFGLFGGVLASIASIAIVLVWEMETGSVELLSVSLRAMVLLSGGIVLGLIADRARGSNQARLRVVSELEVRQREQEEMRAQMDQAHRIADAIRELNLGADSADARRSVCDAACKAAQAPRALLWEPNDDGGLMLTASSGFDPTPVAVRASQDRAAVLRAYRSGEAQFVSDLGDDPEAVTEPVRLAGGSALYSQPIVTGSEVVGVVEAIWSRALESPPAGSIPILDVIGSEAEGVLARAQRSDRLASLAMTDELTGLGNRRAWEVELARQVSRAGREDQPLCVALLDLDKFKSYNDQHGHQAGDRLLRETAQAWAGSLRLSDFVARYGGDEFGVILPSCGLEEGHALIERLRASSPTGSSAGVAAWDRTESAEDLLERADLALYASKRGGRNRTFSDPGRAALAVVGRGSAER